MDAVKFIQERNRMCATYTPKNCEGCPADNYGGEGIACIMIDNIDADRLVPIVEKWSAAHPHKTRQSEFLKQWPNAQIGVDDVLLIRPCNVGVKMVDCCLGEGCNECRREFWMQEVE